MEFRVDDIARLVGGTVVGDGSRTIRGAAGLEDAGPDDLSFLKDSRNSRAVAALKTTRAGAVIVPEDLETNGVTAIRVKNPLAGFAAVLARIESERRAPRKGVHPTASVAASARVAPSAYVGPYCVIEENAVIESGAVLLAQVYVGPRVKIGEGTRIYPQAVLREDTMVGRRCILHAGCVLGSDGYGFYFENNAHNKIPQIGNVILEDDVEVGACSTIDRATTGSTRIGKGVKIDNLVQVAHNVDVGENSLLVAQSGIAGSCRLGKGVVLAGQAGVADHLDIGDGTRIAGQSGVMEDLPPGSTVFGTPAQPIADAFKQTAVLRKLPALAKDLKTLKEKSKDHGRP